ncbi:hypothetical protein ACFPYN_11830 [Paenisporosarcina macmurdoensis]|uniref:Uncharacterized protein n=1 Tax=Paenisporosarcina macmurdoensis TaxID=212659 RepID=A0ABW1L852_9BACL
MSHPPLSLGSFASIKCGPYFNKSSWQMRSILSVILDYEKVITTFEMFIAQTSLTLKLIIET